MKETRTEKFFSIAVGASIMTLSAALAFAVILYAVNKACPS